MAAGEVDRAAQLLQYRYLIIFRKRMANPYFLLLDLREDAVAKFLDDVIALRLRKRKPNGLQISVRLVPWRLLLRMFSTLNLSSAVKGFPQAMALIVFHSAASCFRIILPSVDRR